MFKSSKVNYNNKEGIKSKSAKRMHMTGSEPSTLCLTVQHLSHSDISVFLAPWAKMKFMVEDLVKRGFKPDRSHSELPAWPLTLPL
ncbi:hypothetical protein Y032_0685g1524 [Ancylostoma ceylanicum]|uniref:Uncharacterized protein n=1 Tax=Ancylostoma ceylanicum TaxID=53326 RepID=A0A016WI54_9BILA|nr:hypothetical protein Y032_0685g1524 [Ancylostoma ceylanicum]